MSKLKLGALADEKPVKLTVELPAAVHRDLLAYANALARETGQPIAMYGRRQFDGQFHRLFIGDGTELELCHVRCLTFVRLKHEVAIDDHAHRKPGPDRQCRLDVEILLNNLLSGLVQAIAGSTTEC